MAIKRDLAQTLKRYAKFPVVVILGPRQAGKTTLARETFKKHTYVNLEDPQILQNVVTDPKSFLRQYENKHGIIIDEFQHAPQLLSYIQIEADEKNRPGYFVLTGSQNFLMNQAITQSLAGRAGILDLLPLSIHELERNKTLPEAPETLIFKGGYPRIYAQEMTPGELFPSYIRTYVERDVRQLINVDNLRLFQKFMSLCAGRVGQQLNIADLASTCGIDQKTVTKWLSILEASYIVFLLQPHYKKFTKRVTKTPKLYFYDTGLVCALLKIRSADDVVNSPFKGALFECLIVADFYKQYYNSGLVPALSYWRDQNGRIEIDCLIDVHTQLLPVEIKSAETIASDFFNSIKAWSELAETNPALGYIIYGGQMEQKLPTGHVIPWAAAGSLIKKIEG